MQALVDALPARLRPFTAWLVAALFLFWVHWNGLDCWFFQDDFAWLGLLRQVENVRGLIRILFDPAAQGTIRPWSERGYFLLFEYLFGMNGLPFRLAAFAVMLANLALVIWILRRITGSLTPGILACIVWTANAALMTVMTWNAAFNEALCPLFLLSALALFFRFAETGRWWFWWCQLVVFILGFGALETNVVYPALAAAWVLFAAPPEKRRWLLRSLIAPFVVSVAYFLIHRAVAPIPKTGAYAVHLDGSIFKTLALYLKWSFFAADSAKFGMRHADTVLGVCAVAIVVFAWFEWRARRTTALFFAAWFLISIAPVLPLPNHRTDYYLTIPLIGVGMLAGFAFDKWPVPAVVAALIYLIAMVPVTRGADAWALGRTDAVRAMVEGVETARERHPGKTILLQGVTTDLYNDAFGHSPFFPLNIQNVYLAPGSERVIQPVPDILPLSSAVLDPSIALRTVRGHNAVIYSLSGNHFRNVTEEYERSAPNLLSARLPDHVDAGNALFSDLLGPEWLPAESGFRWMPARATLRLRGPGPNGGKLTIDGYCPEQELRQAPRRLWVIVDGAPAGMTRIDDPEDNFHRLFDLPRSAWGRETIEVELRVDPVVRRDGREYGLVFGRIGLSEN